MDLSNWYWLKTIGAPRSGDPRDGSLHRSISLADKFDLESWDDAADDDARYCRNPAELPEADSEGREIWRYYYTPYGENPPWLTN